MPKDKDAGSVIGPKIKPQITKEYTTSLIVGRPDLKILEDNFEKGDKPYYVSYDGQVELEFINDKIIITGQ